MLNLDRIQKNLTVLQRAVEQDRNIGIHFHGGYTVARADTISENEFMEFELSLAPRQETRTAYLAVNKRGLVIDAYNSVETAKVCASGSRIITVQYTVEIED